MFITDLNIDELVIIFSYCNEIDHKNISKVCSLFEKIIEEHFFERKCRDSLMVTHMKNHYELFERTFKGDMKYADRLKIYQNWMYGTCQQIVFFQHRENYETILEMNYNYLYTSSLGKFNVYKRNKNGIETKQFFSNGSDNTSRISSLKRRGNLIAGCKMNGSILTYDSDNGYNEEQVKNSSEQLNDIDFINDTFVTVSRSDLSFYKLSSELGLQTFDFCKNLNIGFKSINFNPSGERLLTTKADSLHILDPTIPTITHSYLNRTQVFNTKWLDNKNFVFTSYSSPLSLIDTRTEFRRSEFSCGNFTATCMDYDGRYGLIYGTLLGMMVLCDLRNVRTFERVFHLDASAICRHIISDEAHLYVSTDNAIHLLNFDY
ncbi:hypothetical protein PVAND_001592 [Polypedilum vanderplanki]|uniref:F-box domain-containing protein n=1 Tax=Polypedilum vanderplanki TaxID=319348 RepID=A0A9J6BNP2_POLVA|nr:hypothetical protein PVAND_001592 [Polypedilum vanderplanki]